MMNIGIRKYFRVLTTPESKQLCLDNNISLAGYEAHAGRILPVMRRDYESVSDCDWGGWWFPLGAVELLDECPEPSYHQGKPKPGVNYDAGQLLESRRAGVEEALLICMVRYGDLIPRCSSQSVRAQAAIDALGKEPNKTMVSIKIHRLLTEFLVIHQTVSIMENI